MATRAATAFMRTALSRQQGPRLGIDPRERELRPSSRPSSKGPTRVGVDGRPRRGSLASRRTRAAIAHAHARPRSVKRASGHTTRSPTFPLRGRAPSDSPSTTPANRRLVTSRSAPAGCARRPHTSPPRGAPHARAPPADAVLQPAVGPSTAAPRQRGALQRRADGSFLPLPVHPVRTAACLLQAAPGARRIAPTPARAGCRCGAPVALLDQPRSPRRGRGCRRRHPTAAGTAILFAVGSY